MISDGTQISSPTHLSRDRGQSIFLLEMAPSNALGLGRRNLQFSSPFLDSPTSVSRILDLCHLNCHVLRGVFPCCCTALASALVTQPPGYQGLSMVLKPSYHHLMISAVSPIQALHGNGSSGLFLGLLPKSFTQSHNKAETWKLGKITSVHALCVEGPAFVHCT